MWLNVQDALVAYLQGQQLPGGRVIEVLVPVAEQVLRALEDDGRIDATEALSIAGSLFSAVLALRA